MPRLRHNTEATLMGPHARQIEDQLLPSGTDVATVTATNDTAGQDCLDLTIDGYLYRTYDLQAVAY